MCSPERVCGLLVFESILVDHCVSLSSQHLCRFDDVFGEDVDNDLLYATAIRPLISTIFRYVMSGRGDQGPMDAVMTCAL